MTGDVRDAYDAMAGRYAAFVQGDLDRVPAERDWFKAFAELAALGDGAVADLGCGPGHVTNHLADLGLTVLGFDVSPAMIAEAQRAFPGLRFQVGDLTALEVPDAAFAGIVARYSLIHAPPRHLATTFGEWSRVLEFGAPLLISFFAAGSAERHGSPFDHAVITAYELFPPTVVGELERNGFDVVDVGTRSPLPDERKLDHGTILARHRSA